jgi:hypothetical protein
MSPTATILLCLACYVGGFATCLLTAKKLADLFNRR